MQLTALLLVLASWIQLSQAFLLNFDDNGIYVKRQICQSDVIDRSVTSNVQPKPYLVCTDGLMRIIEANVTIAKLQDCPLQLTSVRATCPSPAELGNTDITSTLQTL